jgi:hypothetical protein
MYLLPFEIVFFLVRMMMRAIWWMTAKCMQRAPQWRSMAVMAFPEQRLAAVSGPINAEGDQAMTDTVNQDSASEKEEMERRAASDTPYDEAFGHRDYTLASFHTREGEGFKIVFHFQVKKHRVRRVVWLDFNRLVTRMGRDAAWAMRARLGQAQMRFSVSGPAHPWGRLELPDAWLEIGSSREGKARRFMLDTLDAVNQLIEAGGMDLVSGHHESLPVGDPKPVETIDAVSSKGGKRSRKQRSQSDAVNTPSHLALADKEDAVLSSKPKAALPGVDPAEDRQGLPPGVTPEYVCTGILAATGFTERTDSAGRHYRIFYADVDTGSGKLNRQTGTDLERALFSVKAEVGMRVRLQHLGHVPVNGGRYRRKVWQAAVLAG